MKEDRDNERNQLDKRIVEFPYRDSVNSSLGHISGHRVCSTRRVILFLLLILVSASPLLIYMRVDVHKFLLVLILISFPHLLHIEDMKYIQAEERGLSNTVLVVLRDFLDSHGMNMRLLRKRISLDVKWFVELMVILDSLSQMMSSS